MASTLGSGPYAFSLLLSRMGPPGTAVRGGSAQLSSPVGRLAVAATAAPRPAVLKNDLRESMAGIVLWAAKNLTTEKFNHKGHEGTRSSYSVVKVACRSPKEAHSTIGKRNPQRTRWYTEDVSSL